MASIENPIINSPFEQPKRHFQFTDDGITNVILPGRRDSVYFVPIPKPKSKAGKAGQLGLGLATENEYHPNKLINEIRARVDFWRDRGFPYTTNITRRLLEHWRNPARDRRLFFCQIEALETWIYLTEIAPKHDANIGTNLLAQLENANREATPTGKPVLKRRAAKMATGSGKTVIMAMLIAWQTLNKIQNKQDKRFTDAFLIVAPGITIKDRLRVLLPSDAENYYKRLDIVFDNVDNGQWTHRPNTILVDSQQLESGDSFSDEFRTAATREIEEFKAEIRERFPGRNADDISPTDILREVMNTVGKKDKLGEHVKCVVSVSMLTEGWDTNTVTHIMGVRAFGTQLLCEQVIGRGLRRMNYEAEKQTVTVNGETVEFEAFPVEYAEVYGVPFEFIPSTGNTITKLPNSVTQVHSVEEREASLIHFPNVIGYTHRWPAETLPAPRFTERSSLRLTTRHIATFTENAPIVGESVVHSLDDLKQRRENEVAFLLAKLVLEKYFRHDDDSSHYAIGGRIQNPVKAWLFPQILRITKQWLHGGYVEKTDYTFPQLLLLTELAHSAAERIYQAIVAGAGVADGGEAVLKPLLDPQNPTLDTDGVRFETSKPTYQTNAKSHLSHVVLDSTWEKAMLTALEHLPQVHAYVKNHPSLGFYIPYSHEGREHRYLPDFIARAEVGGRAVNLIIEVSGDKHAAKDAKTAGAQQLWLTAVNNDGRFGRWRFVELKDRDKLAMELEEWLIAGNRGAA